MSKPKGLPFIPVQMPDKAAAFAGKQFLINGTQTPCHNQSKLYRLFRDSIRKLLYANFEWSGDITPIEASYLEYQLIETGRVIAMAANGTVYYGLLGMSDTQSDDQNTVQVLYDFYGQPSYASCTGLNGSVLTADANHFVIGYDTMCTTVISPMVPPTSVYIDALAENLDNAYSAWRVAIDTNKLGMVFNAPDETSARLMQKVLNDISANKPFVITRGNMSQQVNTTYRPGAQGAVSAYYQNLLNAWSLVMDFLGIENESAQKRERMVVEEAVRNNSLSKSLGYDRLRARQIFAQQIGEKLGKHITVTNAYARLLDETDTNGNGMQDTGENINNGGNINDLTS